MKTKMNMTGLKRSMVIVCTAAILGTSVLAQTLPVSKDEPEQSALARLEVLMTTTDQAARYVAPDAFESEEKVAQAFQNLDLLANSIERDLAYQAPVEASLAAGHNNQLTSKKLRRPVQIETPAYTLQETWLISAGYYKSTRTPAWHNIKRTLRNRKAADQYASSF
jgi:hypothetical protein